MSYSINSSLFKSIFAVPTDVVDKHIRLANEHQLKVLLWILCKSPDNPDIQKMCDDINIDISDAADYLQYWVLTGVLKSDGSVPVKSAFTPPEPESVPQTKKVVSVSKKNEEPDLLPSKPSSMEIADRLEESPEIAILFKEAQHKLGKTIGYDGQCTLLLLHDHYGLPTDVLFMLIDYCVSIGKTNYSYIQSVGKDWGTREIDTLDKAAEQIEALRNVNKIWREFANHAGIVNPRPTTSQASFLRRWTNELGFGTDMIILAYEEMANHTGKLNFNYIDKVLSNWHAKKYKKPKDLESAATEPKTAKPKTPNSATASYDLEEFKNRSIYGELKYERKKNKNELQQGNAHKGTADT